MECPKCSGGAYLVEEDLIQVLENTEPVKLMIKATYTCRACSERFTRVIYDDIDARKKQPDGMAPPSPYQTQPQQQSYQQESYSQSSVVRTDDEEDDAAENLKFF
jgi:hypothetical protein